MVYRRSLKTTSTYGGYRQRKAKYAKRRSKAIRSKQIQQSRMWNAPNLRMGGFTGIEKKFFDTTFSNTAIGSTWTGSEKETATFGLFCPQQGDGSSGRDGRNCVMKSLQMRGMLLMPNASDQADTRDAVAVTLLVVLDTQTNGTQAQGEVVMDDTPGATEEWASFRNLEYNRRFRTLARKTFVLHDTAAMTDGTSTGSITGNGRTFQIYKNLNIPVNFSASTGAITDITDNSIHVYAIASVSTKVYLRYNSRIRFVG